MGWQQRDWAKLDEAELEELYGVQPRVAAHAGAFWAVIISLLLTVLGIGWTFREHTPRAQSLTPGLLYGMAIPEGSPLGPPGVCQDLEQLPSGTWRCDTVAINTANEPVIRARPYQGPCTHLQVLGSRWICLNGG